MSGSQHRDEPRRRGLVTVVVMAVLALIALLLGHRELEGYLERQRARQPSAVPELPSTSGVAGRVEFADGSAAEGARVGIVWRDSAGRPGSTPAVTDGDGRFAQGNVPSHASITEIHATLGPLVAKAEGATLPREGTPGPRARLVFPKEFRLAGLVRRTGDRAPVAGAELVFAGRRIVAGADGDFRIEGVPSTVLKEARPVVKITAPGFAPLDWPLPTDALPETYGDLTILMEPAPK